MLDRIESAYVGIGLTIRVFLFLQTRIRNYFEDSGEFVTPLNSWKRGKNVTWNESLWLNVHIFSCRRNLSPKT
jgi:hypothetical protein